jgi:protein involved in polysaccharide export with SLBB domain
LAKRDVVAAERASKRPTPAGLKRLIAVGLCAVAFAAVLAAAVIPAQAQVSPLDALRALRGNGSGSVDNADSTPTQPVIQTFTPAPPPTQTAPPSHLEQIYSDRANMPLQQFGYDALGVPQTATITQSGAVPDGYVLGADDELVVSLRGQENSSYRVRVDRDGNITLPKMPPVPAAGRRFGDFRANLEQEVAQAFISTKVFVALGNIHMVSILVSGEVRAPGVRIVSALASPLDVILLSGGIKKTGSLRAVRVVNGGSSRTIDLYSVVAQGNSSGLGPLRDGDRVYVPPLNATAAVAGDVSRPAIYELSPGSGAISASALLRLAGGPEIAGSYTLSRFVVQRNGGMAMVPINAGTLIHSGEVLYVAMARGATTGRISVRGAVPITGLKPLSTARSVAELFRSAGDLNEDAYAPFAIIKRRDPVTNAITLVPFSITAAIRKTVDVPLQDEDTVFVFSRAEVKLLAATVVVDMNEAYAPAINRGGGSGGPVVAGTSVTTPVVSDNTGNPFVPTVPTTPGAAASAANGAGVLAGAVGGSTTGNGSLSLSPGDSSGSVDPRFTNQNSAITGAAISALAQSQALMDASGGPLRMLHAPQSPDGQRVDGLAGTIGVTPDSLMRTASDNLAWVLDQVREPGPYLSAKGTSIFDLVQTAGGFLQTADLSQIEVTSTAVDQASGRSSTTRTNYSQADGQMALGIVRPLDVVRVRPVYSDREAGTVTVAGQVRYPGVFDITRDERLSSLLQRAGGMTEVAYPYGAIFTRKSAALSEKEGNERSARELENQIPALMFAQNNTTSADFTTAGAYLTTLVRSLREIPALGRIVVTADPTVLATKPDLDFVLQPGDMLYVPKRPSTVTVSGEVRNPGSFQYRAGLSYREYLHFAGGTTQNADEGRVFVVMPDGSAAPIDSDWISFGGSGGNIPPGATVVVPRDLRPFSWSQTLRDATQILSQIAVAAASIAVLTRNN